ncbi:hypothetical protein [Micromonospora sp. NBC_01813]|uniref:hypothetical protein n=1 Tax=Micromonospora sp. NBC_01813 TaxID=2975988 RepID=UPI002DDB011D|nr:hypothetical protein [Micromonospora sp. NBC_01813]WSA12068.1 hypothetical protein OG958_15515 [Micromonospora sp. NBC_01813]
MDTADESPRSALAINNRGLLLVRDSFGTWLIQGSADGLIYAAGDRLVWLLPLLERTPTDIRAALPHMPLAETPLTALVRFALTAWGEHWPALALDWLESGWPIFDVLDVLADMKDSRMLSQPLRDRALRLWLTAPHR